MGDMGDYWRDVSPALKQRNRERRERNVENANPDGWTIHTRYHWSRKLAGHRLDYWPSRNKWRYKNKNYHGDVEGFIRKRE